MWTTQHEPTPRPAPEPAWARVWLYESRSQVAMWSVDQTSPAAQLTIGSHGGCQWRVAAAGVAPVHVSLYWDRKNLWVTSALGAAATINGQVLDDWQPIAGQARIEFGGASLVIEASPARAPASTAELQSRQTIIVSDTASPAAHTGGGAVCAAGTPARGIEPRRNEEAQQTLFSRPPAQAKRGAKKPGTLPMRTWGLLAATCVALSGVLMMDEAPAAKERPAARQEPAAEGESEGEVEGEGRESEPPAASLIVKPATPATSAASAQATQREAAELLVEGQYQEAIALYDELARLDPDNAAYAATARILARKLAERCNGDTPCAP